MIQFSKSRRFGPFRLTLTKRGVSRSFGFGPLRWSRGSDGRLRRTWRIPGTGVYDTEVVDQDGDSS